MVMQQLMALMASGRWKGAVLTHSTRQPREGLLLRYWLPRKRQR
jgi:hypothetical protein